MTSVYKGLTSLILIFSLHFTSANAMAGCGANECRVNGGGQFDAVPSGYPEKEGFTRFSGNISSDCVIGGALDGNWYVDFADGSEFQTSELRWLSYRNDGIDIADLIGWGIYEDEVVEFILRIEQANSGGTDFIAIVLQDLSGAEIAWVGGYVTRGAVNLKPPE
jgi:hypothetical protein